MIASNAIRFSRCLLAGALAAFTSASAYAQAYPTKPIELIVHTSAGSGGDVISRQMAEVVRRDKLLPQPFVVVNKTGGAGVVGYSYFKTKRGDPHFVLSVTSTLLAMAYRPDVAITLDNYTPIALYAIDPQTIMVAADSPYKTFKDLMEAIKRDPGAFTAATTSATGTGRLLLYLIEKQVPGLKIKFVTFKGGSDAVTSVAGGHTQFTTENLAEGMGMVEAKKLRVLAVTIDKRLPQAPDIPTLIEQGFPITAGTIRGFTFTAGVPKQAVETMEAALRKAHQSAEWKDFAKRNMYQDVFLGSAEFAKFLEAKMVEYKEFYDAIGLAGKK
jgi:tripartite-type tricarboxylate transporter receptor subunit TctC